LPIAAFLQALSPMKRRRLARNAVAVKRRFRSLRAFSSDLAAFSSDRARFQEFAFRAVGLSNRALSPIRISRFLGLKPGF